MLLDHGTEAPFCGVLLDEKRAASIAAACAACRLFKAGTKFESGTGWPSFTPPFTADHLE